MIIPRKITTLVALVFFVLGLAAGAKAQVLFDYNPPALGSSEVVKRNDLNAELDGINSAKQEADGELTCLAGLTSAADKLFYFTGSGTCALVDFNSVARSLIDDTTTSAMRTTLGLAIGTDVQAFDSDLTTWAGVTSSANGRSLVSAADYAAMRVLLDLEAGTDFYSKSAADAAFQPLDADLTTLAAGSWTDPNLDQLAWWDDSQGRFEFMTLADMTAEASPAAGDYLVAMDSTGEIRKIDWSSLPGSSGGISDIVQDTTPQLGGALDTNGFGIELGTANTDTTVTRSSAGVMTVEGVTVSMNSTSATHTAGTVELGAASDTTLARSGAGAVTVEGVDVALNSTSLAHTASRYEVGNASDTTITRSAAGVIAVEGVPLRSTESFCVAASDETTAITTGTAKVTFRMPYAFTLTNIRGSLNTVSSSGSPIIDVNEAGTTLMTTNKVLIDVSEKTSVTAATAVTLTDTSLADDAEMTIDVDTAGTGAKGLKICLIGYQT